MPKPEIVMNHSVLINVPGIPPTVNHYVKHTRDGRHYVTGAAKNFKRDIVLCAGKTRLVAKEYSVEINVTLGKGDRGDIDNFAKVCLDGLVDAGIIHSDAAVTSLYMSKQRGRGECGGTVIIARKIK